VDRYSAVDLRDVSSGLTDDGR